MPKSNHVPQTVKNTDDASIVAADRGAYPIFRHSMSGSFGTTLARGLTRQPISWLPCLESFSNPGLLTRWLQQRGSFTRRMEP